MEHVLKTRIAIADDHSLFRKGLIKLLDEDRYELLCEAKNGKALIDKIRQMDPVLPDIVITDIEMSDMDGYETISWLKDHYPSIKALVVSMEDRKESIVRMLRLGVKGYLSKEVEPEDLHAALQSIIKKNYYYTDFVTNKLIHAIQNCDDDSEADMMQNHTLWKSLNGRQKEFIGHACTDKTYEEIAETMFVSPKTVDGYRDVVFERFGVKNRVGLVLYAIKNKLVSV
jgi:two-component system, NarL family, invasion response regulator UvrY